MYEDPSISLMRIHNLLLACSPETGFAFFASQIERYAHQRDATSQRELIFTARAFVKLKSQAEFVEKLPDFYACALPDETLSQLTRACFTDYGPSKLSHAETDLQNAQTLISQPLGVQKAMARGHMRHQQEALLHSPWPQVVEILCTNPDIQQRDIVRMASKRASVNELLEPILFSSWSARTEVRFALAANPALNASHAMRCAASLPRDKLKILAQMPELHDFVRQFVRSLLSYGMERVG